MKGVTVDITDWGSAYMAGLCCWAASIYWLYLTTRCSCFTLLSAKVLLVNLMRRVSLLLEPEMWWKIQQQQEKLENQGGGNNRPGTSQVSFCERSVHCIQQWKKPWANDKLTFGTPFPLGTLGTVMLAKCRQKLQFIVFSLKKKSQQKKKLNTEKSTQSA